MKFLWSKPGFWFWHIWKTFYHSLIWNSAWCSRMVVAIWKETFFQNTNFFMSTINTIIPVSIVLSVPSNETSSSFSTIIMLFSVFTSCSSTRFHKVETTETRFWIICHKLSDEWVQCQSEIKNEFRRCLLHNCIDKKMWVCKQKMLIF